MNFSPAPKARRLKESQNKHHAEFLLAEFKGLRDEILKRSELQNQLLQICTVATGTFIGFSGEIPVEALLLFSVLATFLSLNWSLQDLRIRQLGTYIRERLESKTFGVGWETYFFELRQVHQGRLGRSHWAAYGILIGSQLLTISMYILLKPWTESDLDWSSFDRAFVDRCLLLLEVVPLRTTYLMLSPHPPSWLTPSD